MLAPALASQGIIEHDGTDTTPQLREFLAAAGLRSGATAIPYWGGAFVAWCAIQTGRVPPVGSANPSAWEAWGEPIGEPIPDCVAVVAEGIRRHVGIIVRRSAGRAYIIGAHNGIVSIRRVDEDRIISVRRPPGAVLQPQQSAQSIDIRVSVDRPELQDVIDLPSVSSVPVNVGVDDIEGLRLAAVAAMAAAADASPRAVARLAELAAMATAASTRDGIERARDEALAFVAQT
jgi:uncharacterized protein (TIGR02594 family)